MRKSLIAAIVLLIVFLWVALVGQRVSAQDSSPDAPVSETRGDDSRSVNDQVPNTITSLPMSNPYCYQPDPNANQCYINIRYWQANDNGVGNTLSYALVTIDGKLRYRASTFFESSIYYNYDMIPGGMKVACGLPNEGGYGNLYGKGYTVGLGAYDYTENWQILNSSLVKCPAFNP